MRVDLESRLKVPEEIVVTSLRPDVIVISKTTKQLGIIELTVPTEERIEISGELKRLKYEEIAQEAKKNGWRVKIWAIVEDFLQYSYQHSSRIWVIREVKGRK